MAKPEDISKFESVKPAQGRLVVFINTANAYHGVSELAEPRLEGISYMVAIQHRHLLIQLLA